MTTHRPSRNSELLTQALLALHDLLDVVTTDDDPVTISAVQQARMVLRAHNMLGSDARNRPLGAN